MSNSEEVNDYMDIAEAAKSLPGRPSAGSVYRWATKGIKGRNGEWVRLGHVKVGHKIFITKADIATFLEEKRSADRIVDEPIYAGSVVPIRPTGGARAYLKKRGYKNV